MLSIPLDATSQIPDHETTQTHKRNGEDSNVTGNKWRMMKISVFIS